MAEKEDYTKDKGDTGATGATGPTGPTGPEGPEGPPGTTTWAGITDKPTEFNPEAHKTDHQNGGADEISVAGLAGELTAAQKSTWAKVSGKPTEFNPEAHKTDHQDGGADEISVEGLAGELTAEQKSAWAKVSGKPTEFNPEAHHADHENGGADALTSYGTKNTAAWNKTIGATGDFLTFAAMIADMPDLIAHAVAVTIQAGTTLTDTCNLRNKHGVTPAATISIKAEKYFPTSGQLPTADSATATTLRDAALAAAAKGDDYFNGCWIFIVDGTGTDNGFVKITDYADATGDVVVASWPGTQPDNTSRYLIVGALIDAEATRANCVVLGNNTCIVNMYGIGMNDAANRALNINACFDTGVYYLGVYASDLMGIYLFNCIYTKVHYCGIVNNNTNNAAGYYGVLVNACGNTGVYRCGISDNNIGGIRAASGAFVEARDNFGDGNGVWGTFADSSGQANCIGTECSGSSGNHSNGVGDGSLAY